MARQPTKEEVQELQPLVDEMDDLDEQLAIVKAKWTRGVKRLQKACGVTGMMQLDPVGFKWLQVVQTPAGMGTASIPDADLEKL